jgi:hypothetical protein
MFRSYSKVAFYPCPIRFAYVRVQIGNKMLKNIINSCSCCNQVLLSWWFLLTLIVRADIYFVLLFQVQLLNDVLFTQ